MNNNKRLHQLNLLIEELHKALNEKTIQNLSQLEIDISLDKLKLMYDVVLGLKSGIEKEEDIPVTPEKDANLVSEMEKIPLEIDEDIHSAETNRDDAEIDSEEIIPPEKEDLFMELQTDEPQEKIATEPKVMTQEKHEEEVQEKHEEELVTEQKDIPEEAKAGDVFDLFNETSDEVGSSQETIADKLHKKKLVSIKSAIGINEKFFFLNELFGGDLQVYNDNIELLDANDTLEETKKRFIEIGQKYNWDTESEAYQQLLQMIENKFN